GGGEFGEATGWGLKTLKVGWGQLEAFLFPFCADREPINAAAFDNEPWAQSPRRQEKAMERWVAQAFGFARPFIPDASQRAEKVFIRIPNPKARFGSKPIEPAQPLGSGIEAAIVKNFGFVARAPFGLV